MKNVKSSQKLFLKSDWWLFSFQLSIKYSDFYGGFSKRLLNLSVIYANQELKTIISNRIIKTITLLNPLRGSCVTLLPYPALRTGLLRLNHIRGLDVKILKGFNLNNRGCKPVEKMMYESEPRSGFNNIPLVLSLNRIIY